jgi:hypothetical protein
MSDDDRQERRLRMDLAGGEIVDLDAPAAADADDDDEDRCIRCGRTPSFRLPAAAESPSTAMNGNSVGDPACRSRPRPLEAEVPGHQGPASAFGL